MTIDLVVVSSRCPNIVAAEVLGDSGAEASLAAAIGVTIQVEVLA